MIAAFFIEHLFDPASQLFFGCVVITVVISIVLHELAHGWAAIWQGDDTPRQMGHMTGDPMVHMGGFSLLALVLIGIAWGQMPVNPNRFRSRYGDALVSVAGPAMNLLLAFLTLTALVVWVKASGGAKDGAAYNGQFFLRIFGWWNIVLALFNLIPVPPLDGSAILGNFVPAYRRWVDSLSNPMFLFLILFVLIMSVPQLSPFKLGKVIMEWYLGLYGLYLG